MPNFTHLKHRDKTITKLFVMYDLRVIVRSSGCDTPAQYSDIKIVKNLHCNVSMML